MTNVLLVWPVFPPNYWSFEKVIEIGGKKALLPPLGLVTVAGLLPQDWAFRLVDKNISDVTEDDWAWADVVMLSSMIVQHDDFAATIADAKRRGLPVVVGGPYVTSVPEAAEEAGADYIVMDEGELTIPPFVEAFLSQPTWRRGEGEAARRFNAKGAKPEMDATAMPRFDLLDFSAYAMVSVQFSRGCPFLCEFCDIINLYGRVPRTKPNDLLLAELQSLYDQGWRGGVLMVDDNFIGNKKNVKNLLGDLRTWHRERGNPFFFDTEASVDLAADDDLLQLMVECNFAAVFLGIETPDVDSLELTRKHQNNRTSMNDSVRKIMRLGLRVNGGFIIGFDGEKTGAGQRIAAFIEECNLPFAMLSMLQALPNTGLWTRLTNEGRLRGQIGKGSQTEVLNFVPTRPTAEIMSEYMGAVSTINDPRGFMERMYRHTLEYGLDKPDLPPVSADPNPPASQRRTIADRIAELRRTGMVLRTVWLQGVWRSSRWSFLPRLISLYRKRPDMVGHWLMLCAHNEHFISLTDMTVRDMTPKLATVDREVYVPEVKEATGKAKKRAPVISTHLAAE